MMTELHEFVVKLSAFDLLGFVFTSSTYSVYSTVFRENFSHNSFEIYKLKLQNQKFIDLFSVILKLFKLKTLS